VAREYPFSLPPRSRAFPPSWLFGIIWNHPSFPRMLPHTEVISSSLYRQSRNDGSPFLAAPPVTVPIFQEYPQKAPNVRLSPQMLERIMARSSSSDSPIPPGASFLPIYGVLFPAICRLIFTLLEVKLSLGIRRIPST